MAAFCIFVVYDIQTLLVKRTQFILLIGALCFCFLETSAIAQEVSAVGSNLLRMGSGFNDNTIGGSERKRYFEEIANARIFFNNFSLGLRYEMDDPSEVGPSFQGIRRRWLEYKKDDLDLTAGHVTSLYGRGLTINNFESRPINYDTWLDGFSGKYEYKWTKEESEVRPSLGIQAMEGTLLFHNVGTTPADTGKPDQNISARTVNGEFGLFGKKLLIGASFAQAFTTIPGQGINRIVYTNRETDQPEAYLSFIHGDIAGFFGFTESRSYLPQIRNLPDSAFHRGKALFGSLSYAGSEFGLTMEYKNYEYFVHSNSDPYANYFSKLPISSPPEVYKEFTYTSITRTTHAVNFDDEVGFQIEANITAIPNVAITLNTAASSRHNSYTGKEDSLGNPIIADHTSAFPKFSDNAFFPFWEYFAEVEYELGDLSYIKVFGHRRSDLPAPGQIIRTTTTGAKFQYETAPSQSVLVSFEQQWEYNTDRIENDHNYMNTLVLAQYSFNPIITFGGIFDFSTWYEDVRHIWPEAFVTYRVGGSHTLLMSYGAERGGLNCSGGVCRYVPAFDGLRLTLTSQF